MSVHALELLGKKGYSRNQDIKDRIEILALLETVAIPDQGTIVLCPYTKRMIRHD